MQARLAWDRTTRFLLSGQATRPPDQQLPHQWLVLCKPRKAAKNAYNHSVEISVNKKRQEGQSMGAFGKITVPPSGKSCSQIGPVYYLLQNFLQRTK